MTENDKSDKPGGDACPAAPGVGTEDATPHAAPNPLSRRSFVGSVGASTTVAAAAGVALPSLLVGQGTSVDWNSVARLSQEAFRVAVNEWIGRARVQGGKVSGAAAVLTPGSLLSDVNIETRMIGILSGWRVPPAIGAAVARVLAASWNEWAAGFQMAIPGAYPAFVAVPGRAAPPTRAAVSPALSQGSSAGEPALKAPVLAKRLIEALQAVAPKSSTAEPAMQGLASWVEISFSQWKSLVTLTGLVGRGSAPTYAPPYVPVAPVISGDNASAGPLFAGPRFGIVAP